MAHEAPCGSPAGQGETGRGAWNCGPGQVRTAGGAGVRLSSRRRRSRLSVTGAIPPQNSQIGPVNVWVYRYVKDCPSFSGVRPSRSGNPTRCLGFRRRRRRAEPPSAPPLAALRSPPDVRGRAGHGFGPPTLTTSALRGAGLTLARWAVIPLLSAPPGAWPRCWQGRCSRGRCSPGRCWRDQGRDRDRGRSLSARPDGGRGPARKQG